MYPAGLIESEADNELVPDTILPPTVPIVCKPDKGAGRSGAFELKPVGVVDAEGCVWPDIRLTSISGGGPKRRTPGLTKKKKMIIILTK